MPDWETFKSYFRSKDTNRNLYIKLRDPVSDALGQVALILFERGTGDLPKDSLDDIQERYELLWNMLLDADREVETDRGAAVKTVTGLLDPASGLLADALEGRRLAEARERQRLADIADYEERMERAILLIGNITELAGPEAKPVRIVDKLGDNLDKLQGLIDGGEAMRAIGLLNGIVSALPALEDAIVSLVALRKRKPSELPTSDAKNLKKWDAEVIAAVAKSAPDAVVEPLGNYRAFIVRYERMNDVRHEISGVHPAQRFEGMALRISDILEFPKDMASPTLLDNKRAVKKARTEVTLRLANLAEKEENLRTAVSPDELLQADLEEQVKLAREAANTDLDELDKKLTTAQKAQATHDVAMRKYYAELKKLKSRIELADALPEQVATVDAPWKAEKQTFTQLRAEVTNAVKDDTRDYVTGLAKLLLLKTAIDALVAKKVAALQTEVDTATDTTSGSSHKVLTLMTELVKTPGLIKAMKPEQQLSMLEMLREGQFFCISCNKNFKESQFGAKKCPFCNKADNLQIPAYCANVNCRKPCPCPTLWSASHRCPDCNGAAWLTNTRYDLAEWPDIKESHPNEAIAVARAMILGDMELTPKFQEFDQEKRQEVAQEMRKDPVFTEMTEETWGQWIAEGPPYTKIAAYATSVLKIQCRVFGHDQKGLQRLDEGGVLQDFPDIPVKIQVLSDPSDPGTAGYCKPGFPTWLVLNAASDMFRDFKEVVDTIVHENSHAFQEMLIKKLKAEAPFKKVDSQTLLADPRLGLQAQLFRENDKSYIDSDSLERDDSAHEDLAWRAYRHEPLEEHAWGVGGKLSKALLVPPPTESFRSKHTMRSKTFQVEWLTLGPNARVKLTTRHGIYGDEWEGERGSDKTIILDNVPKGGGRRSQQIKSVRVLDAFTLQLNWDSTGCDEDDSKVGHVRKDGVRMRLDESVTDL